MKMNREFSFAVIVTTYTIWLPGRRANNLNSAAFERSTS